MREMKYSGVEWIGDIPEDWMVMPNKYLMKKKKQICSHYNGEDIISLSMNGVIVRDLDAGGKMPLTFDGYQYIEKGNLLMCLFDIDVTPRCIGIIKCNGLTSPAYSQFVLTEKANAEYYNYYYTMLDNYKILVHLAKNLRHSLTEEQLGLISTIVPPILKQQAIADILDRKCTQIDALIANEEQQIAKLKAYKQSVITETVTKGLDPDVPMKDSGVEWIGEIPYTWSLKATKRLFVIESGATPKSDNPDNFDGDIVWITPADYTTEQVYITDSRRKLTELGLKTCSTSLIPPNSIIFSKRAPIGLVAINHVELCTNQGCLSCISKTNDLIKYYYYVMSIFTDQYNLLGSGTTFKEISLTSFSNFILPCPPVEEQQHIAEYLDQKCEQIDRLIAIKQQKIEKLQQYKKSLIYEYVTGKKEVI